MIAFGIFYRRKGAKECYVGPVQGDDLRNDADAVGRALTVYPFLRPYRATVRAVRILGPGTTNPSSTRE